MKLLVTGGAGFIGSAFIRTTLASGAASAIVNLDKLTYAGNLDNLTTVADDPRYRFIRGDICDAALVDDLFATGRFDAVVALGAVIRGETDHYEHIAREAASGLARVSYRTGVPVGFGVLTVEREEQALARSAPGLGNKGAEAARAAVATVHAVRTLSGKKRRR